MKIIFFESDQNTKKYIKEKAPNHWETTFLDFPLLKTRRNLKVEDVDVISSHVVSQLNAKTLQPFKNLKAIVTRSTGTDHIDLADCKKKKIDVFSVPGYGTTTVAEFTVTLLLSLMRKIPQCTQLVKDANFDQYAVQGCDLQGKTLGLIGFGQIGQHVAKIAQGFGMKILAHDKYQKKFPRSVKKVPLRELYQKSDVLSIHCPSTPQTQNLINKKAFDQMKDDAILINTSRGSIVNTPALYEALQNKKIRGAGLDVMDQERSLFTLQPADQISKLSKKELETALINQKLLQMENVILTPHVAFNTEESQIRQLKETLKHLKHIEKEL